MNKNNSLLNSLPFQGKEATKAFTLVELIVVITILAILGTIAFVSLQGYSRDARDSVRTSDLSRMKTSLELFQLDAGKYPQVSDENVVLYSGATAWTQGTFGDSVFNNVEKLDKIPTDPVNGRKYTYSTTSTRQEYQLAGVMEGGDLALLSETSAATKEGIAKITGNYNGKILKVIDGANTYILAVPSIISAEGFDVQTIAANDRFVYNGYKNLPESYSGTSYEVLGDDGINFVDDTNLLLYSGPTSLLSEASSEGTTARENLITNLQNAYTGTTLAGIGEIREILTVSEAKKEELASTIVSNDLGGSIVASVDGNSNEQEPEPETVLCPSNMVNYWKFDELIDGGDNIEDIVSGNNGTINGAVLESGIIGNAISFDGVDDFVDIGNIGQDLKTLVFWLKPNSTLNKTTGDRDPIVFVDGNGHFEDVFLAFGPSTSNITDEVITLLDTRDLNKRTGVTNVEIPNSSWSQIALVWNEGESRYDIYLNGVLQTVTSGTSEHLSLINIINLRLGTKSTQPDYADQFYNGLLDDISIYNSSLSQEEIQKIYNDGLSGESICTN